MNENELEKFTIYNKNKTVAYDSKALFSVHKFITELKEDIIEEVQAISNDWL